MAKAKAKAKAKPKAKAKAKVKAKAKTKPKQPIVPIAYTSYLVKSEPSVYSFDQLIADKKTSWDGVRNYEARNTMRAMKLGNTILYYHSNEGLEIVGVARVSKEHYQDPTTDEDWSAVEIEPVKKLEMPVTLATVKATKSLAEMALVKKSRISVSGVTEKELVEILKLANTTLS